MSVQGGNNEQHCYDVSPPKASCPDDHKKRSIHYTSPDLSPSPLMLHPGHGPFAIPKKAKRSKSSFSSVTFAATAGNAKDESSDQAVGDGSDNQEPEYVSILVGYAFGPKKMSTMGLIMAEASNMLEDGEELQWDDISSMASRKDSKSAEEHYIGGGVQEPTSKETGNDCQRNVEDAPTLVTCGSEPERKSKEEKEGGHDGQLVASTDTSSVWEGLRKTASKDRRLHQLTKNKRFRVSFVPLDLNYPLEEQHGGKFDAILHKLTEDILLSMPSDSGTRAPIPREEAAAKTFKKEAMERLSHLELYQKECPSCCFVDPPEAVRRVLSRADISRTLSRNLKSVTTASGVAVTTPRFHIAGQAPDKAMDSHLDSLPFGFPIIAKPLTAAGTSESHKMMIVLNRNGLKKLSPRPTLLQEYANHGGMLFKVYALGDDVRVFQRPSLPDLPQGEYGLLDSSACTHVEFDSQKPYPKLSDFGVREILNNKKRQLSHLSDETKLRKAVTASEIRPVATAIRDAFGLDLFGFDILVTHRGGSMELLVVDINYFPSYKEVSNFPSLLAQYLTQRAICSRLQSWRR
jgi:inositol-1,3,4-trisphosphate 5/6-kinase/inositol-tetrakisphosphate 1-kinase